MSLGFLYGVAGQVVAGDATTTTPGVVGTSGSYPHVEPGSLFSSDKVFLTWGPFGGFSTWVYTVVGVILLFVIIVDVISLVVSTSQISIGRSRGSSFMDQSGNRASISAIIRLVVLALCLSLLIPILLGLF